MRKVTGPEATHACKYVQLYAGLKVGIDEEVHRAHYIWDANFIKGDWLFLLIDTKNSFNEIN